MVIAGLTPREAVRAVEARLSAAGCPDADYDARELFRVAAGRDARLSDRVLTTEEAEKLEALCTRREQGLPEGQLDLIVSNPPYLTAEEMRHLQPEVAQEPAMALEAGKDGLVFYRALAEHYQNALRPGGALVLEIGWQQRQTVMELLAGNGWADIECRRDYGGNDRCIIAHRPK